MGSTPNTPKRKLMNVTVHQVENGYVVIDSLYEHGMSSGRKWVATDLTALAALIKKLGVELGET